jgi:hypothetical protein
MYVFQLVIAFLLLCFGFSYYVYSQNQSTVRITSHHNGDIVGNRVKVRGTSTVNDEQHNVWVLVRFRLYSEKWYPQPRPIIDDQDNWEGLAYIGKENGDIGETFEISVATFDKDAEKTILEFHKNGHTNGIWDPIEFPPTTSNIDTITVTKRL